MLDTNLYFLEGITPPTVQHFESRRDRLAQALVADGADAFVLEPGYTFQYYANISQQDWEPWEVCILASSTTNQELTLRMIIA